MVEKIVSSYRGPVTALLCLPHGLLLVGIGGDLHWFRTTNDIITLIKVLPNVITGGNKIHGISYSQKENYILVFGGVETVILELYENGEFMRLKCRKKWREWVLNAKFMSRNGSPGFLAVLFTKPKMTLYSIEGSMVVEECSCNAQWLLFSSSLTGDDWDDDGLTVASGNAISDIVLWKKDGTFVCLKDHQGAVFGLDFFRNKYFVSVSDDRTIRVWCLETLTPLKTLYGHSSRVWKSEFYPNDETGSFIFSISEDCSLRLWNWNLGQCIQTWNDLHIGKNIWSFCIDSDPLPSKVQVYTGGGDGAIYRIKGSREESTSSSIPILVNLPNDEIRDYDVIFGVGYVSTVKGHLFQSCSKSNDFKLILDCLADCLKGHSVLKAIDSDTLLVGDGSGKIHVLEKCRNSGILKERISLQIFESEKVKRIVTLSDHKFAIVPFANANPVVIFDIQKNMIVSRLFGIMNFTCCSNFISDQILVGQANGWVKCFSVETGELRFQFRTPKVDRINSIFWDPKTTPCRVFITNQSGYLFVYSQRLNIFETTCIGTGSLEYHEIIDGNEVSVISHKFSFLVYWNRQLIWEIKNVPARKMFHLDVNCEGDDYSLRLMYLKNGTLCDYRKPSVKALVLERPAKILDCIHGLEIRACHYHENSDCFITGCEMGWLKFWHYNTRNPILKLKLLDSNIKCIETYQNYMIVGGGKQELRLYYIHHINDETDQIMCEELAKQSCLSDDLETRVMAVSFCNLNRIIVAYSDGMIRKYRINQASSTFSIQVVCETEISLGCPFSMTRRESVAPGIIFVGMSDGRIVTLSDGNDGATDEAISVVSSISRDSNQRRAIHDMKICQSPWETDLFWLISCSEDGSIAFDAIKRETGDGLVHVHCQMIPCFSLTAIQSILLFEIFDQPQPQQQQQPQPQQQLIQSNQSNSLLVLFVSKDQRINGFQLYPAAVTGETCKWQQRIDLTLHHKVPDVCSASIALFSHARSKRNHTCTSKRSNTSMIVLAGIGMEWIEINSHFR